MHGTRAREPEVTNYLQSYFQNISRTDLLSAAEECDLAAAIDRGDRDARARMIQANLRLVVRIAREYLNRGLSLDDLIGEGNLGLIRAAEEFDPRFGTRFSTYASYWIKQAIRHALINTTTTIRLPAHMYGLLTKWRRAERRLCRELGREPTFDEVAECLELSDLQKNLLLKAHRANQLKLESSLGDDDRSWTADRTMDNLEGPEVALELNDDREEVLKRMDRLDERERVVIMLRFGIDGDPPLTLREIGRHLGVTREWVRKIELRAVSKLAAEAHPAAQPRSVSRRGRPQRAVANAPLPPNGTAVESSSGNPSYPSSLPLKQRENAVVSIAAAG